MKTWVRNFLIIILIVAPIVIFSLNYLEDVAETGGSVSTQGLMSLVADMSNRVISLASEAGYTGVFVLMLLEAAALPVPSELVLPFAGYLVSTGKLDYWIVVFWSTVAALMGSFIDYYLGWTIGDALFSGKLKLPFVDASHLRRVGAWFNRYGSPAVILLRFVPAARVLISFPAGIYRMDKLKFGVYTLAGCLPWNMVLIYAGWKLGSLWSTVVDAFRYFNILAYAFLILLIAWIVHKLIPRRGKSPSTLSYEKLETNE
jgi:membrane protein DedA with SNARE-associated domain